jgi:asparagine synthase (glutamine-hydrolysing)
MNIIFGIWRPQGPPVTREELKSIAVHTRRFAPDGEWYRITPEIGFGVQAQYTHERSRLESQPASDAAGNVLVFDGRLDNYRNLMSELGLIGDNTSDSEIILCAYRRWGNDCFVRLVGDWALAIWDTQTHTLHLARDHAGTRLLHYSREVSGTIRWATYLDSYLGTSLLDSLDPVYMASYLVMLPCYGRSPYQEIPAVLPGHFLKATSQSAKASPFWTPTQVASHPRRSLENSKAEFLHLFGQSVARRTVPGAPVLAQLSGGMDSTSIVCVADRLRKLSGASSNDEPLDTLSYFDDSDPDWNERPYFTLVEARRGRSGFHMDASIYRDSFEGPTEYGARFLYPGIHKGTLKHDIDLYAITSCGGYRSILSGIGGDEFAGGNPSPASEIADLLVMGRVFSSARRALAWCLAQRTSFVELFGQSISLLTDQAQHANLDPKNTMIPWLTTDTRRHLQTATHELPLVHFRPLFVRPRMSELSETWWYALRTQPHLKPSETFRWEYRYPFLDRDLLEFLFELPYEYLARPGRRRFLMRAALQQIVPEEILERRRKAFLLSSPLRNIRELTTRLAAIIDRSALAQSGYVDKSALRGALDRTVNGDDLRWWGYLVRFATLETWLQHREGARVTHDIDPDLAGTSVPAYKAPMPQAPS